MLLAKQNEVLQDKLQRTEVEEVSQLTVKDAFTPKPTSMDCLISALGKFQNNSGSILSCNGDWQEVATLLRQFGKQNDADAKLGVSSSNVSDVQKESSEILQGQMTAEAVDEVIDKLSACLTEPEPVRVDEDVQKEPEEQNKAAKQVET